MPRLSDKIKAVLKKNVTPPVDQDDPDDELLDETPPDVVQVLGFDPLDED